MKPSFIPNPKQNGASRHGRAGWYPYYAGYCPLFVEQLLSEVESDENVTILDPWNGAGTTSQVAHDLGYRVFGFDLNPAVLFVAKARLLNHNSLRQLRQRLPSIVHRARTFRAKSYFDEDPLRAWFTDRAVTVVRHLDRAIRNEFQCDDVFKLCTGPLVNSSNSACFFYTALFRTLRRLTERFRGSNPTWLKVASTTSQRVEVPMPTLIDVFVSESSAMFDALRDERVLRTSHRRTSTCCLGIASSHRLPVNDDEVDIVVASPPYCTRIDYAVSTRVELAVLGIGRNGQMRHLRDAMTGTSTIRAEVPGRKPVWGRACRRLLNTVSKHTSKASQSYYLKTLLQYFHDIYESLIEIDRCLHDQGDCILVVQDSYYKDVAIRLPTIFQEMGESLGWCLDQRSDFPVSRTMLGVNTRSQRYRSDTTATETVMWFTT